MPVTSSFAKFLTVGLLVALASSAPIHAQYSTQSAGPIAMAKPTATVPIWSRLVLTGKTVTCYYAVGATRPKAWTQIGKTQTLGFANYPVLVGMYLTSHNAAAIGTGTMDNFSISPASTYRLLDTDIGTPALMGTANAHNGVWTLNGAGSDIGGTSDQFNFQPWLVWGDCTITARVTSLAAGDGWERIGLMIRDSYNSGSGYAAFCASYSNGVDFQYRLGDNTNPDQTVLVAPPNAGVNGSMTIGVSSLPSRSFVLRP